MTEIDARFSLEDPGPESGPAPTIRINPPVGGRHVQAFARLAAVVDRAGTIEVPPVDDPEPDAAIRSASSWRCCASTESRASRPRRRATTVAITETTRRTTRSHMGPTAISRRPGERKAIGVPCIARSRAA